MQLFYNKYQTINNMIQPAFVVSNGGLEESYNYVQLYRTKEEAINYALLMRISPTNNIYEIQVPEREESINIMFTHKNKRKSAEYVTSQSECVRIANAYYRSKYEEYLEESLRTKSCNYKHMRVKSCTLFQPNCTILQLFGESGAQLSFSCISDVEYCEE